MTSEQSSARSLAGPVRYTLIVQRPDENGAETGEVITVLVNGLAVPRVGEELYFGSALGAVVTTGFIRPVTRQGTGRSPSMPTCCRAIAPSSSG